MGSIGFNIYGHSAFPVKNDNWHNFQAIGTKNSYLSKLNTKRTKFKKSIISLGQYDESGADLADQG